MKVIITLTVLLIIALIIVIHKGLKLYRSGDLDGFGIYVCGAIAIIGVIAYNLWVLKECYGIFL